MQRIVDESGQRLDVESEVAVDRTIAVLNPGQLNLLRPEADKLYHAVVEHTAETRVTADWHWAMIYMTSFRRSAHGGATTADRNEPARVVVPVYEILAVPGERRSLEISATQLAQLRTISAEFQAKAAEFFRNGTSQADVDRKYDQVAIATRRQIESVLTPRQLNRINEIIFRRISLAALAIPRIQEKVGISPEQIGTLRAIRRDLRQASLRSSLKMQEDLINQLTPQQLQVLREQLSKQ